MELLDALFSTFKYVGTNYYKCPKNLKKNKKKKRLSKFIKISKTRFCSNPSNNFLLPLLSPLTHTVTYSNPNSNSLFRRPREDLSPLYRRSFSSYIPLKPAFSSSLLHILSSAPSQFRSPPLKSAVL